MISWDTLWEGQNALQHRWLQTKGMTIIDENRKLEEGIQIQDIQVRWRENFIKITYIFFHVHVHWQVVTRVTVTVTWRTQLRTPCDKPPKCRRTLSASPTSSRKLWKNLCKQGNVTSESSKPASESCNKHFRTQVSNSRTKEVVPGISSSKDQARPWLTILNELI